MRLRFPQATLALALTLLFLVANRGAYEGYFSDDDLDNLTNTQLAGLDTFARGLGSLTYDSFNFRPVGHLTYRWMGQVWGLNFAPYVALIQMLHLLNAFMVYRVTRSALEHRGAAIAAVFFMFHPALLGAHWKPMYLFDVLCGTALIFAYRAYRSERWVWSLVLFWCGYKAKEVAIFFPLVLLMEEWWGRRTWTRVAPFLGVSLLFGVQALIGNGKRPDSVYSLRFTGAALSECVRFYGGAAWGLPWVLGAAWTWLTAQERRWTVGGIVAATVLLGPMFFLPGRLFSVYLYVPLMFGAVAVGAVMSRCPLPFLLLLALGFGGLGLRELRAFRRAELSQAQATREFVEATCVVLKDKSGLRTVYYEGGPPGLNAWGVEGAIRLCSGNLALDLRTWELSALRTEDVVVRWTKMPGKPGRTELERFDGSLAGSWYSWEGSFRWMGERARVRMSNRTGGRRLLIELSGAQAEVLQVTVNGVALGPRRLAPRGEDLLAFELPTEQQGPDLEIDLWARPVKHVAGDPRDLGVAVRSIEVLP
jgi:hypothetical protein